MDLGLTGKHALVCGGSRGLGGAIAEALVGEGAKVALAARDSDRLRVHAQSLGGFAIPVDLATADGPERAVRDAVQHFGSLDLLVVNSGGPPAGTFDEVDESGWQAAIAGTLESAIRLLRCSLPVLAKAETPAILMILSSSVREPIPGLVTSNVLRPAALGLMKSLVPEVAPVRINGLAPGRVATERIASLDAKRAAAAGIEIAEVQRQTIARIPLGRYGEPIEVGRVAAFLLSPAASYVNGTVVAVDGGMIRSLP